MLNERNMNKNNPVQLSFYSSEALFLYPLESFWISFSKHNDKLKVVIMKLLHQNCNNNLVWSKEQVLFLFILGNPILYSAILRPTITTKTQTDLELQNDSKIFQNT